MIIIPVIGHARSGTSATAQLIERMGASTLPKTVRGVYNSDYQESAVLNGLCCGIHPWHCLSDHNNDDPTILRGITSYLAEHRADILVIKCPAFPFMLPQLLDAIRGMEECGLDMEVHKVFVSRNRQDVARSADRFTLDVFGYDHWYRNVTQAHHLMYEQSNPDEWIEYERLLELPEMVVAQIISRIPALDVPDDHGIRPELNHARGQEHAAKAN